MADQLTYKCRTRLSANFEFDADLFIPFRRAPVTVLFGCSARARRPCCACLPVLSGEIGAVRLNAEDVAMTREMDQVSSACNRVDGRIRSVIPAGALARVELDCGFPRVARVEAQSADEMALREGERVSAAVKATSVHPVAQTSLQ